jgi:hypothetical protein
MGLRRAGTPGGEYPPSGRGKVLQSGGQAVLLYSSKTWLLSTTTLVSLKGFRIRVA